MSNGVSSMAMTSEDVKLIIASKSHIASPGVNKKMSDYIYKNEKFGSNIMNIHLMWEKIQIACRLLVTINDPKDIVAVGGHVFAQRGALKFSKYTGSSSAVQRFTPGSLTNRGQKQFIEPLALVVADPQIDHQCILEASKRGIIVIAFCDSNTHPNGVDCVIPCNNKGRKAIGTMWYLLAREFLRMKGTISRQSPWEVMVDMFFFRDAEEADKEDVGEVEDGANSEGVSSADFDNKMNMNFVPSAMEDPNWMDTDLGTF